MSYSVGTKISLGYLNDTPATPARVARDEYDQYEVGTRLSFKMLACGALLVAIIEPAISIAITVNK